MKNKQLYSQQALILREIDIKARWLWRQETRRWRDNPPVINIKERGDDYYEKGEPYIQEFTRDDIARMEC